MISVRQADDPHRDLPPRVRDAGIIAWCSFLAAGVGTTMLFAFVDPAQMPLDAVPPFLQGRLAIYAVGFFLFWGVAVLAASLTLYIVRTDRWT